MFNVPRTVVTRSMFAAELVAALLAATSVFAQHEPPSEPPADWGPTAIDYSNVPYPHPVSYLNVSLKGEDYRFAYMDVAPVGTPNGQSVVLFHGMNFFAAAFEVTIEALRNKGFRVIAVDRLGYGRSSKPDIHYNLHMPARHTKQLLDHLGIDRVAVLGHSMGGMVATRFTSTYPETTTHVVMANQIGLTDPRHGREWIDPQQAYEDVLGTSYQSVLRGHRRYYPRGWKPEYLHWVWVQYGLTLGGDWPRMARIRAAQRMILFEDPVVHEWQYIKTKALVIGGLRLPEPGPQRRRAATERGTGALSRGWTCAGFRQPGRVPYGGHPFPHVGSERARRSDLEKDAAKGPYCMRRLAPRRTP